MKIECTIQTPQFLGSQDKFWMKEQSGHFDTETFLFTPDDNPNNDQGKHSVMCGDRETFEKYRVKKWGCKSFWRGL